ncbi:MAG: hypothetical protein H7X88_06290 [Gloeobacteraceae cyanobacterium ES-bin-316]|nr:hypothetical protein [Ferruginibacter sp.]
MNNTIRNMHDLEGRIALLKARQKLQIEDLQTCKDKLLVHITPANILKRTLHNFTVKPAAGSPVPDIIAGLVAGFIGKKLYTSKSPGILRKVTAPFVQLFITKFIKNKVTQFRDKIQPDMKLLSSNPPLSRN